MQKITTEIHDLSYLVIAKSDVHDTRAPIYKYKNNISIIGATFNIEISSILAKRTGYRLTVY